MPLGQLLAPNRPASPPSGHHQTHLEQQLSSGSSCHYYLEQMTPLLVSRGSPLRDGSVSWIVMGTKALLVLGAQETMLGGAHKTQTWIWPATPAARGVPGRSREEGTSPRPGCWEQGVVPAVSRACRDVWARGWAPWAERGTQAVPLVKEWATCSSRPRWAAGSGGWGLGGLGSSRRPESQ